MITDSGIADDIRKAVLGRAIALQSISTGDRRHEGTQLSTANVCHSNEPVVWKPNVYLQKVDLGAPIRLFCSIASR